MANWYFVKDGVVVTRFPDGLPARFNHPDRGTISNPGALLPDERAAFGFFEGVPEPEPAFDSDTEQASIVPTPEGGIVREAWVVTPLTQVEINRRFADGMKAIRARRNLLLRLTDFAMLSDAPITAQKRAEWVAYRQALRDLPSSVTSLKGVAWPAPPDGLVGDELSGAMP